MRVEYIKESQTDEYKKIRKGENRMRRSNVHEVTEFSSYEKLRGVENGGEGGDKTGR